MTLVPRCSGIRWPCLAEIRNRILHTASFMELHGVVGVQWTWNIFASQIAHLYRSFSIEPFSDGVSTEGRRIRRICYPKAWYSLMKQRQIWHKIGQVCSKTWHSTYQDIPSMINCHCNPCHGTLSTDAMHSNLKWWCRTILLHQVLQQSLASHTRHLTNMCRSGH